MVGQKSVIFLFKFNTYGATIFGYSGLGTKIIKIKKKL